MDVSQESFESIFFCLVKGTKDGPGYTYFMEKSDKLKKILSSEFLLFYK